MFCGVAVLTSFFACLNATDARLIESIYFSSVSDILQIFCRLK